MTWELRRQKVGFERQVKLDVFYQQHRVGWFVADDLVEGCLVLQLKAVNRVHSRAIAQVMNYLKASDLRVGLLLNFGCTKLEIKRLVNGLQVERSI